MIDLILIGSRALAICCPEAINRPPLDFDFIGSKDAFYCWQELNGVTGPESPTSRGIAVAAAPPCELELLQGSAIAIAAEVKRDPQTIATGMGLLPSLDLLFTIKASHRYLKNSPHFWKTTIDYHAMKRCGAVIRPEYREWFAQREKETYSYHHPRLNTTKSDFFADDGLQYVFDHDSIHRSVKRGERPAYTYYMKDGAQVQCDKGKFFALPQSARIAGVIEEAAVLAIERSLVPHPNVKTPKQAWLYALSKVCSSITSGWFREFAYENIFDIVKSYPHGYWEKFQRDVESGIVIKL